MSSTLDLLHRIGSPPLPPYIRRRPDSAMDGQRYQTVFAREPGAVAAPTAGLHFSDELLGRLSAAGIEHTFVTLHVGLGTFEPVREEPIELHRMHSEWFDCPAQTAASVNAARSAGRRIVAVGTTSVRVLESCRECDEASGGRSNPRGRIVPRAGWTDLFIFPGYRFGAIDALLTNFHLPRSSLLMLTAAFAAPPGSPMSGLDRLLAAYRRAIEQRYRFYSYGDAMLIA